MTDDNKKDNQETVLSGFTNMTPAPDNSQNDATVPINTQHETVLSGLTELDNDKTAISSNVDEDATVATKSQQETVLGGATQSLESIFSAKPSDRITVGSVINQRFHLQKLLGQGGMGEVYLATDQRKVEAQDKNPYIAMKVLGENFKNHPQAFVALQREARKTQDLAHPNIVTVYDFDRQDGTAYLTMEALNGQPVDEALKQNPEGFDNAVTLITQCAQGLAYAHKKDLVHSDLKPGNLFISDEGNIKLLDFGIARAFKSGQALDQKQQESQDTVFDAGDLGALTPAYASLEMINGEQPHPSDDVYALGLIAYELLTGKHPFARKMATTAKEEQLKPERIKSLSKKQWQALEQALAFDRAQRIENADVFLKRFTAKSKTPLYLAASLVTLMFVAMASYQVFYQPELQPDVAFSELPKATQQQFNQEMQSAQTGIKFGDYPGALAHLERAWNLHPHNKQVKQQANAALLKILPIIEQQDLQTKNQQLKILRQHPALKNNAKLEAID